MTERLTRVCVARAASIRDTMQAIDNGAVEIALVVDDQSRLVGTVSDGDIRRALLAGAVLDDPVEPYMHCEFTSVTAEADRVSVLDLMQARGIGQVPVLDAAGRIVALHVLRELVGAEPRPNAAVIMAGGRGTRLSPLTSNVPKPMLPVAGRPILERLVLHLSGSGIGLVFLAVNYLADTIESHFGDGSAMGCTIRYLHEDPERPLGTAGALALLPEDIRGGVNPLLVMNGDLVTQFSVDQLLAAHSNSGAVATIGVREYTHQIPFGVVGERDGWLETLEEKPSLAWQVNAGIYIIEPALINKIPANVEFPMTRLIGDALRSGELVRSYRLDGDWSDVGRPEDLRRARGDVR